ncbi:MAG: tetratricopeptide repeat protein [Microscillaceae bacterium]|nr:tetratricopeptide repeat protein [Microscillaceae bacterium]MDW8460419.1 tetratricopeptide repeat protein [Cytophagales bacterium]
MKNTRIEYLQKILAENPNDTFSLYALALEYLSLDEEKAKYYLEILLQDFPDYLPTYYQAAQFFALQNEIEKAKHLLQKGIALAQKQNDGHTLKELQKALQNLTNNQLE